MLDFDALNQLLGTENMLSMGQGYDPEQFETQHD